MMRRPAWEKELRQSIRGRAKRPRRRNWLATRWFGLVVVGVFATLLAGSGRADFGPYGEGIGIGIVGGLLGLHLGTQLRHCRRLHLWAGLWTPAGRHETRRLQLREGAPWLAGDMVAALAICGLVPWLDAGVELLPLFGGLALAGVTGFILAGGVWGNRVLYLAGLGVLITAIIFGWALRGEDREFYQRLVSAAAHGWPPSLPWAMLHGRLPVISLQGILLAGVMAISVRDWIRGWRDWPVPLQWDEPPLSDKEAGSLPEMPATPAEDAAGIAETRRGDLRKSVAFEWLGMAGYLDPDMSPLGRVLWRFLTPRERYLSCLGSPRHRWWFRQSLWALATLAAMVAVALLPRLFVLDDDLLAARVVALILLGGAAAYLGWPARHSVFEPWLEKMTTEATGAFPVFAMLPVTVREWLRAIGKEWLARGGWSSLGWGVALVTAYGGQESDASARVVWLLAFLPAAMTAALFPLSALVLALRSVAGPLLATHGSTRSMPAMFLALFCVLGTAVAGFCFAMDGQADGVALIGLFASLLSGWASLRFTRLRCESCRLDLKPEPVA